MEEEEKEAPEATEVSADALEAAFVGEEVILEEEVTEFIITKEDDDEVDLAFQEDEGYW